MTLQTLDILYLSLSVGFLILVYFLVLLIKRVHTTLDNVDVILTRFRNTTDDLEDMKNKAKGTFYTVASMILGMMFKKKKR